MREKAPAGWKGDDTREKQVLNASVPHSGERSSSDAGPFRDHQESTRLLMTETIQLGDLSILVTQKDVKNVHLSVHPPDGRVTLVAPEYHDPLDVARAYAISKLGWIRTSNGAKLISQARETPRQFVDAREPLSLGSALSVVRRLVEARCQAIRVSLDHKQRITLTVRPGSDAAKRSRGHSRMAQVAAS